jgi:hypothetical protein
MDLEEHLIEIGLDPYLARTMAEAIPKLTGNREFTYIARNMICELEKYIENWEELTPEEILNLELPPDKGLVTIAREQPWRLEYKVREYVQSRCNDCSMLLYHNNGLNDVVQRLCAEARQLAESSEIQR